MNVSSSSFASSITSQMQPMQRQAQPNASELSTDILEVSDLDSDSLLAIEEVSLSEELFSSMDSNSDGSLSDEEIETTLSSMLENISNQKTSPEEFGTMLSDMGLEVPAAPSGEGAKPSGGGGGGGAETSSSEESYDAADTNQDGTVSSSEYSEYSEYYSSNATEDEMAEYTMTLVSTFMDALKTEQTENGTEDDIDLSKFKQIMTMVNEQTQDEKTAEKLGKYISAL